MASYSNPKKERIDRYIDENLKKVFADYEKDKMPDEIVDMLALLRAQDKDMKADK